MRRFFLLAMLILLAVGHEAPAASAHPIDSVNTDQYSRLEVGRDLVRLRYVIEMGDIPAYMERRAVDLNKVHGSFIGEAVSFLSEIRPEDFNGPRALWENVWDEGARERFVSNISGHMSNCTVEEIIKRQIAIFREVSDDLATRLEKATGVKGYPGIAGLRFNGSHNGMADDGANKSANGMNPDEASGQSMNNGAPRAGTHHN